MLDLQVDGQGHISNMYCSRIHPEDLGEHFFHVNIFLITKNISLDANVYGMQFLNSKKLVLTFCIIPSYYSHVQLTFTY